MNLRWFRHNYCFLLCPHSLRSNGKLPRCPPNCIIFRFQLTYSRSSLNTKLITAVLFEDYLRVFRRPVWRKATPRATSGPLRGLPRRLCRRLSRRLPRRLSEAQSEVYQLKSITLIYHVYEYQYCSSIITSSPSIFRCEEGHDDNYFGVRRARK